MSAPLRPSQRLDAARYQRMREAGFTDEDIRADGFELPDQRPESIASDATRAMTVRPEPVEETQRDPYGPARTMVNALTVGTSPTIRGAVHAAGSILPGGRSPAEAYREEKDAEIAGIRNFAQRKPGTATALNVAASLPLALAGGGRAASMLSGPPKALRNLAVGTGTGAGVGGISSFGGTEGGILDQLKAVPKGAAIGGAIGLGASAGLGALAAGKRKAVPFARSVAGRPSADQLTEGTDDAFKEWLLATNQSPANVTSRAQQARDAGVKSVTTGEAMGPAGVAVVKNMKPMNPPSRGRAFQAGSDLQDAATKRASSQEVSDLYADAKAIGSVTLPAKGQRAMAYLHAKFPKLGKEINDMIEADAINNPKIWDEMVDPATGDFTVQYLDQFKKAVDAKVFGKTEAAVAKQAKAVAWVKQHSHGVKEALGDFVEAIDDGIQKKTGTSAYRDARRTAGAGIEVQNELSVTQKALGKELQRAAGRVQPEGLSEEANALARFSAGQPKMGFFRTLLDPLAGGLRTTGRKQADATLAELLRTDPDVLFEELAKRSVSRGAKAGRGSAFRSVTAPTVLSRRSPRPPAQD